MIFESDLDKTGCASDLTSNEYYMREETAEIAYKRHRSLFVITETD